MSTAVKKKLDVVEQLIIQGNYPEASKIIEKITGKKDAAIEDKLSAQVLQSEILNKKGLYQDALKKIDLILEQSFGIDIPLIDLDALIQKSEALLRINNLEQHKRTYEEGEKHLQTLIDLPSKIIAKRQALISALKSWIPFLIGEFEKSLEFSEKGLTFAEKSENKLLITQQLYIVGWNYLFLEKYELAEHHFKKGFTIAEEIGNKQEIAYGHHSLAAIAQKNRAFSEAKDLWKKAIDMNKKLGTSRDLPFIYNELGYHYRNRLELDLALDCFLKIIEMSGENTAGVHIILGNLGYLYYVKGNYEEAEKHYLLALEKCEEIGDKKRYLPIILRNLIRLTVDKKDMKSANNFLKLLEQLQLDIKEKRIKRAYQFASAYVYKASSRLLDWNKAVEFLEEILKEEEVTPYEEVSALIDISSILMRELHYTGKQEVLDEIKQKVERLVKLAEERRYHMLLAQAYWLQSQLSLAEYDIDKAKDYLFKAKTIAEFKKIEKLRKEIQKDQDKLEHNMHVWEDLIKKKKPLVESLSMLSLENGVEKIAKDAVIEVVDEETGKTIEYQKLFAIKI